MPLPVIDIAQMRAWEAATWASGVTETEVIERAGQAVAARAQQMTRRGDRILVLAGKGHNGDDARRAAGHLTEREVNLLNLTAPETGLSPLQAQLARQPALVIDGLFGIGLSRPLSVGWLEVINAINQTRAPILAVDVPSGLNADTGESWGGVIGAAVTLTFGAPKKGLLATRAWPAVGRLEVAPDIGLIPCPHRSELYWTIPTELEFPRRRQVDSHKGTFGHLLVIAGSQGYHGAAVLATRGALCARPGLVTLWTAANAYYPAASQLQAAMVQPWRAELKAPDSTTAYLIGPGLASEDVPPELKAIARQIWEKAQEPVVIDASALDWLTPSPDPIGGVRVITPHPGEAARLLKTTTAKIQDDRPAALRALSNRYGRCWVVLKGHQTVVGRESGELYINPSGNPYLAQGGSGDVLAGYLAGWLAQPAGEADPLTAIRYGVWQHGTAADALQATRAHWQVENLFDVLGGVVAF